MSSQPNHGSVQSSPEVAPVSPANSPNLNVKLDRVSTANSYNIGALSLIITTFPALGWQPRCRNMSPSTMFPTYTFVPALDVQDWQERSTKSVVRTFTQHNTWRTCSQQRWALYIHCGRPCALPSASESSLLATPPSRRPLSVED